NKAFSQKIHLNYHIMMHNKERPHVCPVCGKGFIRRYYLKDHVNKRHGTIEDYDVQENND
ncbi:zf-H2C2 2 domain containing protein, partial [Asbolus verrucosus]